MCNKVLPGHTFSFSQAFPGILGTSSGKDVSLKPQNCLGITEKLRQNFCDSPLSHLLILCSWSWMAGEARIAHRFGPGTVSRRFKPVNVKSTPLCEARCFVFPFIRAEDTGGQDW